MTVVARASRSGRVRGVRLSLSGYQRETRRPARHGTATVRRHTKPSVWTCAMRPSGDPRCAKVGSEHAREVIRLCLDDSLVPFPAGILQSDKRSWLGFGWLTSHFNGIAGSWRSVLPARSTMIPTGTKGIISFLPRRGPPAPRGCRNRRFHSQNPGFSDKFSARPVISLRKADSLGYNSSVYALLGIP